MKYMGSLYISTEVTCSLGLWAAALWSYMVIYYSHKLTSDDNSIAVTLKQNELQKQS